MWKWLHCLVVCCIFVFEHFKYFDTRLVLLECVYTLQHLLYQCLAGSLEILSGPRAPVGPFWIHGTRCYQWVPMT